MEERVVEYEDLEVDEEGLGQAKGSASPRRAARHPAPLRAWLRPSPIHLFVAAFLLLLGAAAAIALDQLVYPSDMAPWLSMGYSAGAVILTVAAVFRRRT